MMGGNRDVDLFYGGCHRWGYIYTYMGRDRVVPPWPGLRA